jgi:hypothetical protein
MVVVESCLFCCTAEPHCRLDLLPGCAAKGSVFNVMENHSSVVWDEIVNQSVELLVSGCPSGGQGQSQCRQGPMRMLQWSSQQCDDWMMQVGPSS